MKNPLPYLMDSSGKNCGPAGVSAATGEVLSLVMNKWGGKFRGDRSDSPLHHSRCLRNLNIGQKIVTCGDILAGRCPPDRTIVLLHGLEGNATLNEHWAVLAPITPVPGAPDKRIHLYLGNNVAGEARWYTHEKFTDLYHEGIPTCCAYTVGDVGPEFPLPVLSAWQKFWCWWTTL